jgi:hypothetical protein
MGTTYRIAKQGNLEFTIDEHSNKLDLCVGANVELNGTKYGNGSIAVTMSNLAPEAVIQMALEMLKVCSYWTEDGTVERAIAEFRSRGYHW